MEFSAEPIKCEALWNKTRGLSSMSARRPEMDSSQPQVEFMGFPWLLFEKRLRGSRALGYTIPEAEQPQPLGARKRHGMILRIGELE
jgi:hypothetical protein